jgi:hypothetical protein
MLAHGSKFPALLPRNPGSFARRSMFEKGMIFLYTDQGCQTVYFYTKKIELWVTLRGPWYGKCLNTKFLSTLNLLRHLGYTNMAIWYIFGHLVHFPTFWYIGPTKIWQP